MDNPRYWLVGIDGTQTRDPNYWFDRWELVGPYSHAGQAITRWILNRGDWLRPGDSNYIEIWEAKEEPFSVIDWLHNNVVWNGHFNAQLKCKPIRLRAHQ